ncbi:MAG: adenine deaminase [Candidatus Cloacimonadota bacterium]|nr:adenine deaminase [Candidatus Cloacimonadota bacterium]
MDLSINNIRIIDVIEEKIFSASVGINRGKVVKISSSTIRAKQIIDGTGKFLSPGFIDAHFHIESTNLTPINFAQIALRNGTTAVVADCHEICNVAGMEGFEYFRESCKKAELDIFLTAPSCVPASSLGTSGAEINLTNIRKMFSYDEVIALGEMMNFSGVIHGQPDVLAKIELAKKSGKLVNGHAPNLRGNDLKKYVTAGISDDHESTSYEEISEKRSLGMKIFLREGSAEHLPDNCYSFLKSDRDNFMFCSDDKLASDLLENGHINYNIKKSVKLGIDPVRALRTATYNAAKHYEIDNYGAILKENVANLVILNNLQNFIPDEVIFHGKPVLKRENQSEKPAITISQNILHSVKITPLQNIPKIPKKYMHMAISITDGLIITKKMSVQNDSEIDSERDLLKLVVVERHGKNGNISCCRINGFGLKRGALASSIAHDCHNIIAVGTNNTDIRLAINSIIENQGGLSISENGNISIAKLPVGGLMSRLTCEEFAPKMNKLERKAKKLGTELSSPFGTISFLALEVIPELKLSDMGLVDVNNFEIL